MGRERGKQCLPCSTNFSMTLHKLQTKILSTETSDILKEIPILKSFNSVLYVKKKQLHPSY